MRRETRHKPSRSFPSPRILFPASRQAEDVAVTSRAPPAQSGACFQITALRVQSKELTGRHDARESIKGTQRGVCGGGGVITMLGHGNGTASSADVTSIQ